jgi:hypothetical protein
MSRQTFWHTLFAYSHSTEASPWFILTEERKDNRRTTRFEDRRTKEQKLIAMI